MLVRYVALEHFMSDSIQPTPEPRRERVSNVKTVARVADPTVAYLEQGSTLGILVAAHSESNGDGYLLEDVTWARCTFDSGLLRRVLRKQSIQHQHFDQVKIHEFEAGIYVAEDQDSRRFFPNPSKTPYQTQFVSLEQFESLLGAIRSENVKTLYRCLDLIPYSGVVVKRRKTRTAKTSLGFGDRFKDNLVGA
jgi:hypothetical protein